MKTLNELWYEACLELWELSEDRPYLRNDITMWDAFKYLYVKLTPKLSGRHSLKGLE